MTLPIKDTMASPSPQRRVLAADKYRHTKHYPSPMMSPGNKRRKDVGDYWLGKTLGRGSSGRVKIGIHKVTGEKVAIKIISKSHLAANASVEKAVKREIAVMKLISHPNIMSLLDVIDLSDSPNLYIVLEYVQGGELFEYLVSQGRLEEKEARKYFQQIIIGLDYCHRHLICHRDLKPENLLLDREKNIKIADFGMASLQPTGQLLETSCGSPHYASPEIVNGIPYDGSASDIWSCGIILYALLSGHLPFDDDNIRTLLNKVKVGKYKIPDHLSDEARDLITKILVINPAKRLTMKQVQMHPWFTVDPPPNPTTLPDPPTAAEIGRPVANASEIDDRILESLKVLWTDLSDEKVIGALLNSEYNMQKVTYVLLQRHANSYWQTERDDDIRSVASPAKRRRPATICAVSDGGKEAFPGLNEMMSKLADREKMTITPPGIQPHPHSHQQLPQQLQQQSLSRPNSTLRPIIIPCHSPQQPQQQQLQEPVTATPTDVISNTTTFNTVIDTMMQEDNPPPVPPKPIVIRADQIFDPTLSTPPPPSIQHWLFTPVQQRRQTMWHSPITNRPNTNPFTFNTNNSNTSDTTTTSNTNMLFNNNQYYAPQQQHYAHSPQQHMNINHMLSPRAPASSVLNYQYARYSQNPSSTTSSSNRMTPPFMHHHQDTSTHHTSYINSSSGSQNKLNRFMQTIWHKSSSNRVDPAVKLSQPMFDRKAIESSSSVWRDQIPLLSHHQPSTNMFSSVASSDASSVTRQRSSLLKQQPQPMMTMEAPPVIVPSSPRLSSWLPGLFHFKQPKVCSLECEARDEREAIGKISQVLQEYMEGSINERQDLDGRIRRRGEMKLPYHIKPILLRFKLEVYQLETPAQKKRVYRINFIQQQGDAMALVAAVKLVNTTLQTYEQEAELVAAANGWNTTSSSHHQRGSNIIM